MKDSCDKPDGRAVISQLAFRIVFSDFGRGENQCLQRLIKEDELSFGNHSFLFIFLLLSHLFELIGQVTLSTADGYGFLAVDTKYFGDVISSQREVEVNHRIYESTPQRVEDKH